MLSKLFTLSSPNFIYYLQRLSGERLCFTSTTYTDLSTALQLKTKRTLSLTSMISIKTSRSFEAST